MAFTRSTEEHGVSGPQEGDWSHLLDLYYESFAVKDNSGAGLTAQAGWDVLTD